MDIATNYGPDVKVCVCFHDISAQYSIVKIDEEHLIVFTVDTKAVHMDRWSDGNAMGLFARRSVNDLLWGYQVQMAVRFLKGRMYFAQI